MRGFPVVVGFRGMPASPALREAVEAHARRLWLAMPGLGVQRLEARVERRLWPSRPPSVQVALVIVLPQAVLAAQAGDFGRSNGLIAVEAAFEALRSRIARLPLPSVRPPRWAGGFAAAG